MTALLVKTIRLELNIIILGLILTVLPFSGCSGSKPINIAIQSMEELNCGGNACVIYIYQLRNDTNFLQAPIESFWQEGNRAFEDDIVEKELKFQLIPKETTSIKLNISQETKFIGAAADFACSEKEGWRQVHSLDIKRPKELWVVVGYNKIELRYE